MFFCPALGSFSEEIDQEHRHQRRSDDDDEQSQSKMYDAIVHKSPPLILLLPLRTTKPPTSSIVRPASPFYELANAWFGTCSQFVGRSLEDDLRFRRIQHWNWIQHDDSIGDLQRTVSCRAWTTMLLTLPVLARLYHQLVDHVAHDRV